MAKSINSAEECASVETRTARKVLGCLIFTSMNGIVPIKMRCGDTAKPFEHFLEAVFVIVIVANLVALVLLFFGYIKVPGRVDKRVAPMPTPSTYAAPR